MKNIHKKIRALRKQQGHTLEEVASGIGMSKGNLSRLERGEISVSEARISTIADFFGIPVLQLLEVEVMGEEELHMQLAAREYQILRMQQAAENFLVTALDDFTKREAEKNILDGPPSERALERLFSIPGLQHLIATENLPLGNPFILKFKQFQEEKLRHLRNNLMQQFDENQS